MAILNGTSVANLLNGTSSADTLDGKAGNDTLNGAGGNDTLIGGTGNDSMAGGAGNDLYIVNSTLDKVSEAGGSGIDTVQSSVSFTLGGGLEHLVLTGTAANGTGNTLNNQITGNNSANKLTGADGNDTLAGSGGVDTLNGGAGNDWLDGGTGSDSMVGGAGNDTYVVSAAGDIVVDSGGVDTVMASVTHVLSAGIEKLTLTGANAIHGTGNTGNNTLTGNSAGNMLSGLGGADTLDGAAGNDTLTGGTGADSLVGGAGDDALVWDAADIKVNGGAGTDMLRVDGATALDLTTVSDTKIVNVEVINLAGTNTLTLDASDVLALSTTSNTLRVNGGAGDLVTSDEDWVLTGNAGGYSTWTNNGATLEVQDGLEFNDINHAPTLDGMTVNSSIVEDATLTGDATISFGDLDLHDEHTPQAAIDGENPLGGTVNLSVPGEGQVNVSYSVGSGAIQYLAEDETTDVVVTVTIDDGQGGTLEQDATFTITGVNDAVAISAANETGAVTEDADVVGGDLSDTGTITFDDVDLIDTHTVSVMPDEDNTLNGNLVAEVADAATGGGDGTVDWTYTVDNDAVQHLGAGATAIETFTVTLDDGHGGTVTQDVTVTVTGVNDAPIAVDDSQTTDEDDNLVFAASTLADDGIDVDGPALTVTSVGNAVNGTVNLAGGNITFTPDADFNGFATFEYTLSDGSLSDTGLVTVSVTAANDAAVITGAGTGAVAEDGTLEATGDLNLTDVDGSGEESFQAASGSTTHGAYSVTTAGTWDFDLNNTAAQALGGGETVDDTFTVTSFDGTTHEVTITITGVNDTAVISGTTTGAVTDGGTLTASGDLDVTDVDAGEATFQTQAGGVSSYGSYTVDSTGAWSYELDDANTGVQALGEGATAIDIFTVESADGTEQGVTITITGANDAPVNTVAGAQSTSILDNLAIAGISVADVDIGSGELTITLSADLGSISLGQVTGLDFAAGDGGNDASMEFSGSTADVNAALASLVFHATQAGNATITLASDDGDLTDTDTIGVTVSAAAKLTTLDGANGFRLDGVDAGDRSGESVASAGDVNGDGYDDVIVGASYAGSGAGESYVVFGGSAFGSVLDLGALDGNNGFLLEGVIGKNGYSVASAGDVNGDGFDDLIVGALNVDNYRGDSYVVFGKSGFASSVDLNALDGTDGFRIVHIDGGYDRLGSSVASAGDVNGDGFDDLIVGAMGADGFVGESYVVFGKASGFASAINPSTLDGTNGFLLDGIDVGGFTGAKVSSAGDVDGDGYDDLIIGAPGFLSGDQSGSSYVVFGGSSFASSIDLGVLDGTDGFRMGGVSAGDQAGYSVSSAGDVNGDGYADVIVGAPRVGGYDTGASYVVLGGPGLGSSVDLSALDGSDGFRVAGFGSNGLSGFSVASAGDFNGDGYDDLLVGAREVNATNGQTYVIFGGASFDSAISVAALDGTNGIVIDGNAGGRSGASVASAGDVNGDGYADIIIGAPWADSMTGGSYVVYGGDLTGAVDFSGTAGADTLTGTGAAEAFVVGKGNDTLIGGGGADAFRGGEGDDRIVVGDAAFLDVDGGSGTDTLAVGANALNLDLTSIADSKVTGIEKIELTGFGNNTLTLDLLDVLSLSDTSNTLTIDGDAGDTVTVSDGTWAESTDGDYTVYTLGTAILRIDSDIIAVTIDTVT